jgi:hypothetical protein
VAFCPQRPDAHDFGDAKEKMQYDSGPMSGIGFTRENLVEGEGLDAERHHIVSHFGNFVAHNDNRLLRAMMHHLKHHRQLQMALGIRKASILAPFRLWTRPVALEYVSLYPWKLRTVFMFCEIYPHTRIRLENLLEREMHLQLVHVRV